MWIQGEELGSIFAVVLMSHSEDKNQEPYHGCNTPHDRALPASPGASPLPRHSGRPGTLVSCQFFQHECSLWPTRFACTSPLSWRTSPILRWLTPSHHTSGTKANAPTWGVSLTPNTSGSSCRLSECRILSPWNRCSRL